MFVSFFVMKIEYKRFGASIFKYEVREKRSYCTRECMKNINFKTIRTMSAWNNYLSFNINACGVGSSAEI